MKNNNEFRITIHTDKEKLVKQMQICVDRNFALISDGDELSVLFQGAIKFNFKKEQLILVF